MNKQLVTISMLLCIAGLSIHGLAADDTAKKPKENSRITWKYGVAVRCGAGRESTIYRSIQARIPRIINFKRIDQR